MATRNYCCFKGRGEIALVDYSAYLAKTAGLVPVGNASQFEIQVSEKTEEVPDYTSPDGGTACRTREIEKVELALTLMCHSPANLVRAAYGHGASEGVTSAAVVGEEHVLWPGAVEPLAHLIDDSVAVVVKSQDDVTTYVNGTDYEITPAGSIKHLAGGTIPAPTVTASVGQPNIKVSYTRKVQTLIQVYSKVSAPMRLHFDGFNVAGDKPMPQHFDLYKVELSAAKSMAMISDSIGKLEFTGTALRDTSLPRGTLASPLSQYGTLKL